MAHSDDETGRFVLPAEENDGTLQALSEPLLSRAEVLSVDDGDAPADSNDGSSSTKSWMGPLLLLFASFLYATLNISLRGLYLMPDPPSPSALSATRGWLIMAFFLPLLRYGRIQQQSTTTPLPQKSLWRVAGELAIWNFIGQALYTWGIALVSSARASFLGQTSVVMVPLIVSLSGSGEPFRFWHGISCTLSLLGLMLLSAHDQHQDDNVSPVDTPQFGLGAGDAMILGAAVCWSFYIITTSKYADKHDAIYLQGTKNAILVVLYTTWWWVSSLHSHESLWKGWRDGKAWAILVYSALGPGILADLVQQKGQASAGATESNVILCLESVFTAGLGRVLLGEETSWMEKLGGTCLVVSALISGIQTT